MSGPVTSSLVVAGPSTFTPSVTKASAATLAWDGVAAPASTLTLTGGVNVTTATGVNLMSLAAPTITDASAVTVDLSSTLYIGGAPVAGGSATLTAKYALWVDSGDVRFDGNLGFGAASTVNGIDIKRANGGAGVEVQAWNTSNTASSSARLRAQVGGSSAGDAMLGLDVSGGASWSISIDNSVTGDPLVIASTTTAGTAATDVLTITTTGSCVLGGQVALATNATDGFVYIPTCAGPPTGAPTAFVGHVAVVYDTTNHKLRIFDVSWLGGTTPGAWV